MTYCLGIINRAGLVLAADSRTNAGVDHISTYRKLFDFSNPGERVIIACTSGNLSLTQGAIAQFKRDLQDPEAANLHNLPTMYEVSRYIGEKIRVLQESDGPWLKKDKIDFKCSFLLGGQIRGEEPQLYLIYSQGNGIQAMPETPFLQIGETKYGKPILDRTLTFDTPLDAVAKCALLSIDSTMKSNISVGPPINVVMYHANSFAIRHKLQLRLGDPYLAKVRMQWQESLRQAFNSVPDLEWEQTDDAEEIIID
ncbi:proteasome-type protease [Oscillatoria sp. FACHB-1406]|uniref:proteasome-type protease n=1 Tax=Oscillatoria sp. FACHB-1406 TaxID=2692846 RepID=UPI0016849D7E|nr:proteasome-type protease [Oscillatoria sp. FACHB-1406]MBD2579011.1 proteasome-type protease [Oscillatoria sp. FACHB-1406]